MIQKAFDIVAAAVAAICLVVVMLSVCAAISKVHARDLGQWETSSPELRQWYRSLMQPDNPTMSCCGEADAYYCEDYKSVNGQAQCTINDDRDDGPLRRLHMENGTVIKIPNHKLKWDAGNPTGRGVVFLSGMIMGERYVYCYVQPGGV